MNVISNNLNIINNFVDSQLQEKESVEESITPHDYNTLIHNALDVLAHEKKWLKDPSLTKRVIEKLETIEPKTVEDRANTVAVYMKILNSTDQKQSFSLNTISIKLSNNEIINLPKRLLMAESSVFRERIINCPQRCIDLSGETNVESLNEFISYLATGKTKEISDKNALGLLLLASKYQFTELSKECLEYLLSSENKRTIHVNDLRLVSEEESNLQQLIEEARNCSITVTKQNSEIPHISMLDGSKKEQWDCLKKLHELVPVTHLILTGEKNLNYLLDFVDGNSKIVSLNLGPSEKIDDTYLERLSQNLLNLHSFSIKYAQITVIPQIISNHLIAVNCFMCDKLENVNAPLATMVDCRYCTKLEKLNVPMATTVKCSHLDKLKNLNTPMATMVDCSFCTTLEKLNVPMATTVICSYSDKLKTVYAPSAVIVSCYNCKRLEMIDAPVAEVLGCSHNQSLKEINAPLAVDVDLFRTYSLNKESYSKLIHTLQRNILITFFGNMGELDTHLNNYFNYARAAEYGDSGALFIKEWFTAVQKIYNTAEFATEDQQLASRLEIDDLLEKLSLFFNTKQGLKESQLEWFKKLKKLNNPRQEVNRILWLAAVLTNCTLDNNPFDDAETYPTLSAIASLPNPFLQKQATRALFSIYGNSERKKVWNQLSENLKGHLLIPCLFFTQAGIDSDTIKKTLAGLEVRNYKNNESLNPILEMTSLLSDSLSIFEAKKIVEIIFTPPERGFRENRKAFDKRLESYRINQKKGIKACRDLLLLNKKEELLKASSIDQILEVHGRVYHEIFEVKEELSQALNDAFESKRYPNGLLTYASRLQTLKHEEKIPLMKLLSGFVNELLEGKFPESRYNLSINPHLKTVFKDREELLEKWREPFKIDLNMIDNLIQKSLTPPEATVHKEMKMAIDYKHLGPNQELNYPNLLAALKAENSKSIEVTVKELKQKLKTLEKQNEVKMIEDKGNLLHNRTDIKKRTEHLKIEIDCLRALAPKITLSKRLGILRSLRRNLPPDNEFRNDVEGIISKLNPFEPSRETWKTLETTESWEDLLLMGTEVANSCQRIDGNPDFNKCLLAYILDGKNKLMIVRDSEGKIAARSVLRILWDPKQNSPVLFMERIYTEKGDSALEDLIVKGCVEKAKEMKLPLVASQGNASKNLYPNPLQALGGPANFEYVDALLGVQREGKFIIPASNIIYSPALSTQNAHAADFSDEEWFPLGYYALTSNADSAAQADFFIELRINQEKEIGGVSYNSKTNITQIIEGSVDQEDQKAYWTLDGDEDGRVASTDIDNFTKDKIPINVHFPDNSIQAWTLVRSQQKQ